MIIHLKQSDVNVWVTGTGKPMWVLLHGFMGDHRDYLKLASTLPGTVLIPDLLGHGATQSTPQQSFSMPAQLSVLHEVLDRSVDSGAKINLAGYSMGGRVAIAYAATYPERIARLIVESGRPGMRTDADRMARQIHDQELAERLLNGGLEAFVTQWEQLPLFESQWQLANEIRNAVRECRLSQNAANLARSLVEMGAGQQPSYWSALTTFNFPTLLITGELDAKFTAIAQEMARQLPNSNHQIVTSAGHNVHLEAPEKYLELLLDGGDFNAVN